ncbi:MAG: hypothetical protein OEZ39_05140 [Gammaproteobacteria bacterium]|nr:hypothetical protein [Gammaproteobacteria bacterium]MDH5651238.1 hypothetical protein [Gammaproteobacteria bacterium]
MQFDSKRPFLLAFKGKGGDVDWRLRSLQQQLELLQASCVEIDCAMQSLIDRFKQSFRPPWPAHLILHNTGNGKYVRWRLPANRLTRQTYFELLHSDTGIGLLQSLPSAVRKVYLEFEQERLQLNLLYGSSHYEARNLERYLDSVRRLISLKRGL